MNPQELSELLGKAIKLLGIVESFNPEVGKSKIFREILSDLHAASVQINQQVAGESIGQPATPQASGTNDLDRFDRIEF